MPIACQELDVFKRPSAVVMTLKACGKLTKEDYEVFSAEFSRVSKAQEEVRLLILLEDFHGWTASALWEDVKFDAKHFNDVERIAIVGDSSWAEAVTFLYKPFTKATVRYFPDSEIENARGWIMTP